MSSRLCLRCSNSLTKHGYESPSEYAIRRYCSVSCSVRSRAYPKRKPRSDSRTVRSLDLVVRNQKTGCLEWTGFTDRKGYGRVGSILGETIAHRAAWVIAHGPVPEGAHVLHKCDNRKCVDVTHLFLGTNIDNIKDRCAKGRSWRPRGVDNPQAKLTESQVVGIRNDQRARIEIGRDYGVSLRTISLIKRHRTWKHIP